MKNRIVALLLLVCLAFTGCAPAENETHSHSHAYATWWAADAENHWHSCEAEPGCMEKADLAKHSFSEDACSVCGAVQVDYNTVEIYDEYGNVIYRGHDPDGIHSNRWVYEYYDDGEIKTSTQYSGSSLSSKAFRRPCEDTEKGGYYTFRCINYNRNGSYIVNEFDEKDIQRSTEYDADGNVTDLLEFVYHYDEKDNVIRRDMYVDHAINRVELYEYSGSGVITRSEYQYYDKLGRVAATNVCDYDKRGFDEKMAVTSYGVLVCEYEFVLDDGYINYCAKQTYYRKDGSIDYEKHYKWDTACYERYLSKDVFYNHSGEIEAEVFFDRQGYVRQTRIH